MKVMSNMELQSLDKLALDNFVAYLQIKTVQPNPDYASAVQFLKTIAQQLELPIQVFEYVPGKPVVVISWIGKDPSLPSILLNSHTDVVPVFEEYWKYDPFSATIDEKGDIYARGSQDMKCVGIQYIEAVRRMKLNGKQPLRTIHMSFVPDEEVSGFDGMGSFCNSDDFEKLNIGFALDEGLANPDDSFTAYYAERAVWWVEFLFTGNPGHGSLLIENTAAEKFRYIVNCVLDFRANAEKRLKLSPDLSIGCITTMNLTIVQGGVQTNVVPSKITAVVDMRVSPKDNPDELLEMLDKWCAEAGPGVTYRFTQEISVLAGVKKGDPKLITSTDKNDPWWKAFASGASEAGIKLKTDIFTGATDSRYLRAMGFPAIGFSPMNRTPVLLHDHNERLNKDVFLSGIPIYCHIIEKISNVADFSK